MESGKPCKAGQVIQGGPRGKSRGTFNWKELQVGAQWSVGEQSYSQTHQTGLRTDWGRRWGKGKILVSKNYPLNQMQSLPYIKRPFLRGTTLRGGSSAEKGAGTALQRGLDSLSQNIYLLGVLLQLSFLLPLSLDPRSPFLTGQLQMEAIGLGLSLPQLK